MARKIWIDSDTASDDAVAIMMALRSRSVDVKGVSIVSGNVSVEQGCKNALYTIELCECSTPVYKGAKKPILRPVKRATSFHGNDGMGDMNYPAAHMNVHETNGIIALLNAFKENKCDMELVTLGPLTNIAAALLIEPDLAEWISKCTIMGGAACTVGNTTPAAEYNIWCDPEAASIVFNSGMSITMVGWEHCRGSNAILKEDIEKIRNFNTIYGQYLLDCNRSLLKNFITKYGDEGIPLPDPITMAIALNKDVGTVTSDCYVSISTDSEHTRGMTIVDELRVTGNEPNVEVCWSIDTRLWKETLFESLQE